LNDSLYPPNPPRDRFIEELVRLYVSSEVASYGQILKVRARLPELYRGLSDPDTLPTFSKTALSETLNKRRKGFPTAGWVTAFVLCCQVIACDTTGRANPGLSTVPDWLAMLHQAEGESRKLGLDLRRGPGVSDVEEDTAGRNRSFTAVAPQGERGTRRLDLAALTPSHFSRLADFGAYGGALRPRLLGGEADALFQAALLLGVDPEAEQAVIELLTFASAREHPEALDLLNCSPIVLDRDAARQHAADLAANAEHDGRTDCARVFHACSEQYMAFTQIVDPRAGAAPRKSDGSSEQRPL
jgi:hypothetical protein